MSSFQFVFGCLSLGVFGMAAILFAFGYAATVIDRMQDRHRQRITLAANKAAGTRLAEVSLWFAEDPPTRLGIEALGQILQATGEIDIVLARDSWRKRTGINVPLLGEDPWGSNSTLPMPSSSTRRLSSPSGSE